ncbi:hypothetical protein DYB38_009453 [Aphanomyces astaci]|uniref:Myb-like domain-containing protein n=1 Tax=Aphanomyces astaci TaxID=112090 RepID=A0A397CQ96_APHAT|nr:hypothetical protein DYB38_009453 [Aphanomyces astaci]
MSTPPKRRNFTEEEDIMLLRQVSADMPFLARRGLIMDKWAAIAETLAANEDFGRPDFDAKKANNRFIALAEAHRKSNRVSARASGISEDVGEKVALLDDILSAHDDAKEEESQRIADAKKTQEHNDNLGSVVREEAMQSLGKRKHDVDDDGACRGGDGKILKVTTMMHEQVQSELEFQREKHENEIKERQKDRELLAQQIWNQQESMRIQQESMAALIKLLMNKQ